MEENLVAGFYLHLRHSFRGEIHGKRTACGASRWNSLILLVRQAKAYICDKRWCDHVFHHCSLFQTQTGDTFNFRIMLWNISPSKGSTMSSANWDRKSTSRAREAEKQSIAISLIWSAESYWGLEAAFQLDVPKICIFFAPVWNGARRWVVNGLMVERDLHVGSNLTLFWFTKIYCEFVLICIWFFTSLTCFLFFWLFHVAEQCVKAPEVNGISVFHLKQRSLTQHANAARYRSSWRHRVSELACQHCARLR